MRKTIAELMSVDFVTVTAHMSLEEALILLLESDATELCVVDGQDRFEGIVTDYDLLKSHLNLSGQLASLRVGSIISRAVTVLPANAFIEQAIPLFRDGSCSRAYVCRDGRLLGRLSRSNVLSHLSGRDRVVETPPAVRSVRTTLTTGHSAAIDTREATPPAPLFMATPTVSVLGSLCVERS